MKTYTLTESELQELLRQQRELCAKNLTTAYYGVNRWGDRTIDRNKQEESIINASSPLLSTEEVGIKEDDLQTSQKPFEDLSYNERLEKLIQLQEDYNILEYKYSECIANKIHPQPSTSLASHSCTIGNSIQVFPMDFIKKVKEFARIYARYESGTDKIGFVYLTQLDGILIDAFYNVLNSDKNDEGSDTTGSDNSN